ncbi:MAG: tRNA uridine-5-carboxymethylaminomethyl(34) synthesis GTPase MnmE [Gemmatimonadota bacterium]|nr:MAG: tRNA uridine-5-carboxymethylaminomethyl(34) synthesis GTPase MnmE [Gemmatimonadota bacterium]
MLTDVIAALATPPGRSGLALVRVSGSGAHEVARRVLTRFRAEPWRTARLSPAVHPTRRELLDEALYVTYRAPASYTGEDMVEISTHGGLLVPAEVLGALHAAGARQAVAGEFTRRAVVNGKLDLLQAEAVADLIDATAPAQRRAALGQLDRGLSARIGGLREQVLQLEALVSYEIDFPEEDGGPVPPERIAEAIAAVESALSRLIGTAGEGERLREGALAVIAGRPNAGKSSLFNALLGSERAIVTHVPGTTRDAIEAPATCGGFPFRLIDTAGLRESGDAVERIGIEVSLRYLAAADVVIFCAEAGRALTEEEQGFLAGVEAPLVRVRTKADLAEPSRAAQGDEVVVSVQTGEGLAALRARLAELAFTTLAGRGDVEPLITRERHRDALERALLEVRGFRCARDEGFEGAVAATHLRAAVAALEDVIGVVTAEDVLELVFATFCVGK